MSNVSSEVDSLTLMYLLNPKLPEAPNLSADFSSHKLVVMYGHRRHEVPRKKKGTGACLDSNPPIVFTDGKPKQKRAQSPGALADRLSALLSDYWYVAVILAALVFWFFKIPSRRLAD